MKEFTPGPWHIIDHDEGYCSVLAKDELIAKVRIPEDTDNARLIAAAPELFDSLNDLIEIVRVRISEERILITPNLMKILDFAINAMKKAEGIDHD